MLENDYYDNTKLSIFFAISIYIFNIIKINFNFDLLLVSEKIFNEIDRCLKHP